LSTDANYEKKNHPNDEHVKTLIINAIKSRSVELYSTIEMFDKAIDNMFNSFYPKILDRLDLSKFSANILSKYLKS
jgi:hypothetical protein